MKKIPLMFLAFALNANAQTMECPKESKGEKLSGYEVLYDEQTELQGEFKKVKGGYQVELPLSFKYFVCEYGSVTKREEVKLKNNLSSCTLFVREGKKKKLKNIKLVCK